MWNERQWRERRIGSGEMVWSWAIVALIVIPLAAWAAIEVFTQDAPMPVAAHASH